MSGANYLAEERKPLGWHWRGYHPHFDDPGRLQNVGFRLADSVPQHLLRRWRAEVERGSDEVRAARLHRLVSRFEDTGYGACHLRQPAVASMVQEVLLFGDDDAYRLIDWCVMPNHVHVLLQPQRPLPGIVRAWKAVTARRANRILRRSGSFWMADYYDRFIRDYRHLEAVQRYIRQNPVAAGLCREPHQWPWSSARYRRIE
ncbi:MAG: transposase [Acidobacteriota bacterium]|nr:transposase [Acidobacteriota bacterium]MDE3265790.1 transposase [Acidobacteriota bacterium]